MAAIGYARHAIEEYVPAWFATQTYLNTYSVMFSPLPDQCTWERTGRPLIDPPIMQKKVGRPKKSRKRAQNEPNKEKRKFFVICSFCGGSNHNMRSRPLRPSVARANRAKNHNSQASQTATAAKSIDSEVATSQTARKGCHSCGRPWSKLKRIVGGCLEKKMQNHHLGEAVVDLGMEQLPIGGLWAMFIPIAESLDTSYYVSRYIGNPEDENADECGSLAEFNAPALAMQYSFSNFSLKNLSQLASINFDLVVKKPPNHLFHDKFIRLKPGARITFLNLVNYSSSCLIRII
ncbi:hypothetical protein WN944_001785 [Citrus x changshan-huyou]|uniref:Uncharacterized protein n=1 Tax=Citrus x changshan-huyou TaxID=2935761 RepID=A0AAP0MHS9_9ROSI